MSYTTLVLVGDPAETCCLPEETGILRTLVAMVRSRTINQNGQLHLFLSLSFKVQWVSDPRESSYIEKAKRILTLWCAWCCCLRQRRIRDVSGLTPLLDPFRSWTLKSRPRLGSPLKANLGVTKEMVLKKTGREYTSDDDVRQSRGGLDVAESDFQYFPRASDWSNSVSSAWTR